MRNANPRRHYPTAQVASSFGSAQSARIILGTWMIVVAVLSLWLATL
ncbi:hypothetical protein DFR70_105123 [Nocardia tenerifensis]|uniref:Uncharacterized protein n=1 Tax=Nocardia tenerifensis TaxID=228006 RepID=A0A318KD87_9NOCA|nr:hypothetical protein DFR70_105123 [Nocardia tenerifensis]